MQQEPVERIPAWQGYASVSVYLQNAYLLASNHRFQLLRWPQKSLSYSNYDNIVM